MHPRDHAGGAGRLHVHPVRVLAVPADQTVFVCFLGPVEGLLTHFYKRRTIPCLGSTDCPSAVHKDRVIWKGYAPVEQWEQSSGGWRAACLEVTEHLDERLRGRELRGEVWELVRVKGKGTATIVTGEYQERRKAEMLREAFELQPILQRFYRINTLNLGLPNPVPARTAMPLILGNPPAMLATSHPSPSPDSTEESQAALDRARKAASRPLVNGRISTVRYS